MPKPSVNPYTELERLTLELLCRLIGDALENPESTPPAALLGTAVSLLRAGQVPAASTAQQRESSTTSASWFHDLPDAAKAKLMDGPAAQYISQALEPEDEAKPTEECPHCSFKFDAEEWGVHGCPNCSGEGLEKEDSEEE